MKKMCAAVAALLLCVALTGCGASEVSGGDVVEVRPSPGGTAVPAPEGGYPRLTLTRYEEVVDGESLMLCPQTEDGEYAYLNTLIAIRIRGRIRSQGEPVSSSFRIKCNGGGVLSMVVDFFDMATDELVDKLPLTYDLAYGRELQLQDCFAGDGEEWRVSLPDMVTKQADARNMVLLSELPPIADGQLFYSTGSSLVLIYRPYEISTYSAGWPEFTISLDRLKEWLDKEGALYRQLSLLDIPTEQPEEENEEAEADVSDASQEAKQ